MIRKNQGLEKNQRAEVMNGLGYEGFYEYIKFLYTKTKDPNGFYKENPDAIRLLQHYSLERLIEEAEVICYLADNGGMYRNVLRLYLAAIKQKTNTEPFIEWSYRVEKHKKCQLKESPDHAQGVDMTHSKDDEPQVKLEDAKRNFY